MAEAKKKKTTKKATTTKKGKSSSVKKTTTKKATNKKPVKKTTTAKNVKKVESIETEVQVAPVEVKQVEIVTEDTFNEKLAETQPILTVEKEVKEEAKLENIEVVKAAPLDPVNDDDYKGNKSGHRPIDTGILVVLVGMFILVLITYVTSAYNISYVLTNILVAVSLVIEAIGIIIILINLSKKN